MRLTMMAIAVCLITGCVSPPKPRDCEGQFRPVNATGQKAVQLDEAQSLALCRKERDHV